MEKVIAEKNLKRVIWIMFIFLIFIVGVAAYPAGEQLNLNIPCFINNSAFCSSTAQCNVTVFYPNTTLLFNNTVASNQISFHNLTINGQLVQTIGAYPYHVVCTDGGYSFKISSQLDVTRTTITYTTPQSILVSTILFFSIFIFLLCSYGFIVLPFDNERNEQGYLSQITWKKYLKMFCFAWAYVSLTALVYLSWNLSYAFLYNDSLSRFFQASFTILIGLAVPIFIVGCTLAVIRFLSDRKFEKMMSQGLKVR